VTPHVARPNPNFCATERPQGVPAATRVFNQVMLKGASGRFSGQGQIDYGNESGHDWYGLVAIGRESVAPTVALSLRVERYSDPHQVIAVTGTPEGLVTNGASLGVDVGKAAGLMWRTEVRGMRATSPLFPSQGAPNATRTNLVIVTSLALTVS
jgi:hypothetical protein